MQKRVDTIPPEVMETLARYTWPGNVRELQNLMERSVTLSRGTVLVVPLTELRVAKAEPVTLKDAENDHVLCVLEESDGVVGHAAMRLGLPRTTLLYLLR